MRKVSPAIANIGVGLLKVDRNWIVDAGLDSGGRQVNDVGRSTVWEPEPSGRGAHGCRVRAPYSVEFALEMAPILKTAEVSPTEVSGKNNRLGHAIETSLFNGAVDHQGKKAVQRKAFPEVFTSQS